MVIGKKVITQNLVLLVTVKKKFYTEVSKGLKNIIAKKDTTITLRCNIYSYLMSTTLVLGLVICYVSLAKENL